MKRLWRIVGDFCFITQLVVDLFCGAGGTTSGFEDARDLYGRRIAHVVYCINHDKNAIRSHAANHPDTLHMTEDIRTAAMQPIIDAIKYWKGLCPWAKVILWASLECTNHSNAKGGLSRDADSRSLAEHMIRYVDALKPDFVWIENVKEFRQWGPLIQKVDKKTGKLMFQWNKKLKMLMPVMVPDKTKLATFFNPWVDSIKAMGYGYEDVNMNAAHYGAHQNRTRYFASFYRNVDEHGFPVATHEKGLPVRELLDFTNEGESIFDPNRKKAITSDKTYGRLKGGILNHVVPGEESFIVKYNSMNQKTGVANGSSINEPCPAVTVQQRLQVANVEFMIQYYSGGGQTASIDNASPCVTTKDRMSKAKVVFMDNQYGASKASSIDEPVGCITVNPKQNPVTVNWIDNRYGSGTHNHSSIDDPCGTILGVPKQAVMKAEHFIIDGNFNNGAKSINDPCPAVLASRHWHYLVNAKTMDDSHFIFDNSFNNGAKSIDEPCPTLIARQDKKPLNFASIKHGAVTPRVVIRETDNPKVRPVHIFPGGTVVYNIPKKKGAYRELIEVMAAYGIVDIKMRGLLIKELLKIQGFPEDYVLIGTQAEQKKYIGNAVHKAIPKAWAERTHELILQQAA